MMTSTKTFDIQKLDLAWKNLCGTGSHAKVYKVTISDEIVAVKVIRKKDMVLPNRNLDKRWKIRSLIGKHPNVIEFYAVDKDLRVIVMEFMDNSDLHTHLKFNPKQKLSTLLDWMIDICRGMAHLHSKHVIHQALMPWCVLIGKDNTAKVSGFSYCDCLLDRTYIEVIDKSELSRKYHMLPPECWYNATESRIRSYRTDIWSFGMLVWGMITLNIPFDNLIKKYIRIGLRTTQRCIDEIFHLEHVPVIFRTIINLCLVVKHDDRTTTFTDLLEILEIERQSNEIIECGNHHCSKPDLIDFLWPSYMHNDNVDYPVFDHGDGNVFEHCLEFDIQWPPKIFDIQQSGLTRKRKIGETTRGETYTYIYEDELVVVKALDERCDTLSRLKQILNISSLLKNHENIVSIHGICKDFPAVVMEHVKYRDLHHYLRENPEQKMNTILNWATDICRAMAYLHEHRIVHQCLTTNNVLIGEDMTAKLTGFRYSKRLLDCDNDGQSYMKIIDENERNRKFFMLPPGTFFIL